MDREIRESDETRAPASDTRAIRVVGINGSLSPKGATQKVVSLALGGASDYGVTTRLIDLRDYELVFCGTATNSVRATVPVGEFPAGVAVSPDGEFVYVSNRDGGSVSVISTASDAVVATVGVGSLPRGIAVAP